MAKKRFDSINADELIAKHNGTAATLVRKLAGGEEPSGSPTLVGSANGTSTPSEAPRKRAGRPKSEPKKRTTIFIAEDLLAALRREKYENNKDATQVINEALRRYFGL